MQYAKPVTLNVEECDRLSFLPYLFGNDFLYAEAYVYALAQKMMPEYQGGFWHFIRLPDSECVFAVVLTRGDVRHIAQDWNLSDDELETVMQRLDDAFEHGADVSVVHGVVRELMEEKRASRQVTVPAVMLEKVLALAGSEMKRLYAVGSENGGDGDAFVREEREAMDVVLQALDGEHMS